MEYWRGYNLVVRNNEIKRSPKEDIVITESINEQQLKRASKTKIKNFYHGREGSSQQLLWNSVTETAMSAAASPNHRL